MNNFMRDIATAAEQTILDNKVQNKTVTPRSLDL